MKYGIRSNGNPHGRVYTNQSVVNFIIDLSSREVSSILGKTIIDPAVGTGAFIIPIIQRIQNECDGDLLKINESLKNIYIYDIDETAIDGLIRNILKILLDKKSIEYINITIGNFLLAKAPKADIIIGNPPYIRYDNIPEVQREKYKKLFYSFSGRADIYIPFIEKSMKLLNPGGVLSFVCSDRWFNNNYGKNLRSLVNQNFNMKYIFKINGFNPFREDVIAYPSIFLIKNDGKTDSFAYTEVETLEELENCIYKEKFDALYFNSKSEIEYDNYSKFLYSIEDQNFKIGIGVATGADKVFIVNKSVEVEDEILIPLVTRKDIKESKILWSGQYLINTYSKSGNGLLDIDQFPKLRGYLEAHYDILINRHIAKKNSRNWYKLIDPVKKDLLEKPKLLIPDISSKNTIIYDEGNFYPHHNFYYITSNNNKDLLVLRSLLSTAFVQKQVAQKGLLMNGGALRWQAQTLRKIYLPKICDLSIEIKDLLIGYYENDFFDKIDEFIKDLVSLNTTSPSVAMVYKRGEIPSVTQLCIS
ncbi:MAG: Eco57I restriction-modification methylase domain-containing protein [Spirochaetales bacterium]|nr:Eco57I restriction-modification methylase domain-containing protein [Spirochaetales bacterium]